MTYRDPLYDANSPASDGTIDQELEDVSSGSGTDEAKAKVDDLAEQGKQAAGQAREKGEEALDQAREKGQEAMQQAREKADDLADTAHEKADQGLDKASEGLSAAADKLREQGEKQDGQVGNVAATAADKLESASSYLRERDTNQLIDDLEDLVRRRPLESMVAAAGIGLLLSRIVK